MPDILPTQDRVEAYFKSGYRDRTANRMARAPARSRWS